MTAQLIYGGSGRYFWVCDECMMAGEPTSRVSAANQAAEHNEVDDA